MSKRISLVMLGLLAFAMCWSGVQRASGQQEQGLKQTLVIYYPNPSIIIAGNGTTATRYGGLIYVRVFPASPELVSKRGTGTIVSTELAPSQRVVSQLPVGKYDIHFSVRTGSELKTLIKRDVTLRADSANYVSVEMNSDAKTTVIGGDMSAQEMADSIRQLQKEVAGLKSK